mmetsp:Transcript_39969/g.61160  ORF Transcript_39969/g.61160 Transcript_39969/m.61160 type:complete len:90 (+) Transcript_39969:9828-10097(+)
MGRLMPTEPLLLLAQVAQLEIPELPDQLEQLEHVLVIIIKKDPLKPPSDQTQQLKNPRGLPFQKQSPIRALVLHRTSPKPNDKQKVGLS